MEQQKNEEQLAGKHRNANDKTVEGREAEGSLKGSKKSAFNERNMQEHERPNNNEMDHLDAREDATNTGPAGI
ncbi:hypothetical protein [Paracnuella aquatica]|uniref:hypothetical protein n=1 Tax=Paracnuella aquatica TaxID=2268757 RepID=UPI000F511E0D|nr:hypothetical protein [Paracnuella aquatica]RPD48118.1 hypothetical protein DRJ53_10230 [Paracnuella aquatica]